MISNTNRVIYHRQRRKQLLVQLAGGKCVCCDYSKCLRALEFHHIDRATKSFGLGAKGTKSIESQIEELRKCVLLCANCHREIEDGIKVLPEILPALLSTFEEIQNLFWENYPMLSPRRPQPLKLCLKCQIQIHKTSREFCRRCYHATKPTKIQWPTPEKMEEWVWSESVSSIAKQLGISDVAVTKFCKKHNIQTPKRGFWSKQKALQLKQQLATYFK